MEQASGSNDKQPPSNVIIFGVELAHGYYLASGATTPVEKKPDKKTGYVYYDGKTLFLQDYTFSGSGFPLSDASVGIYLGEGCESIEFRGESTIRVRGKQKTVALHAECEKLTVRGKGTLTLRADGGALGNIGIECSGILCVKSGTLRAQASLPAIDETSEEERYLGDSYAICMGKLVARLARISCNSRDDTTLNHNDDEAVVISFPKLLPFLLPFGMLFIATVAILVAIWAIHWRGPQIMEPDFPILDVDPNARPIEGDDDDPSGSGNSGGGSVVLKYTYDAAVDLSDETVELYFGLPRRSDKNAVVQVVIGDVLVSQSGRLPPGYEIDTLTLHDAAKNRLRQGIYNGELRIYYYNGETGERAIVNTKIEVTITVTQ